MQFTMWQQPARGTISLDPTSLVPKPAAVEIKSKHEKVDVGPF